MPVLHGVIWQSDLLRGAQAQSNEDAQEHQRLLSAAQGRSASLASRAASVSAVDEHEHEHEHEHASTCLSLLTVEDDGAVALGKSSSVSSLSASTRRALEKLAEKRRTAAPVLLRLARSTGGDLSVISLDATLDGRAEQQLRRRAFDRDELHKLNQLAQLGRSLSSRPSTAMSGKSCSVSDYPVENHSGAGLGLVGWKVRRMRAHSQRQKAAPRRIAFADEPVALERDARRTVQLQARSSFKSPSTEQLSLSLQRNTVLSSLPRDYLFSTRSTFASCRRCIEVSQNSTSANNKRLQTVHCTFLTTASQHRNAALSSKQHQIEAKATILLLR